MTCCAMVLAEDNAALSAEEVSFVLPRSVMMALRLLAAVLCAVL